MKKKFITAILATMFVMICAMTTLAAGWEFNGENWKYIDKYGLEVMSEWKKDENRYFYLNEEGVMATSSLIDEGEYFRYVDETGAMVVNTWKMLDMDNDREINWLYFKENGKSVTSGWKDIADKKYHFTNNVMDYGWLDADGNMISGEDAWKTATYFCGDENDGAMRTGWMEVQTEDCKVWVYFKSNGKKVADGQYLIDGVKYHFDADGKMNTGIVQTPTDFASASFYNKDGSLVKNAWVQSTVDDVQYWFYAGNNGDLYRNTVKKINNKWYAFDKDAKMLTGFVVVSFENKIPGAVASAEEVSSMEFMREEKEIPATVMYFNEEGGSVEGEALIGRQTIELADGAFTFAFSKQGMITPGVATVENGFLYIGGILQKHDKDDNDLNYGVVEFGGKSYLINTNGKVVVKDVTDCDNHKWVVTDEEIKLLVKNEKTKDYEVKRTWKR